ncbi:MAG TPA: hypothetical protein VGM02_04130 [Acidobacteriaceae bacterium]|jgi:hypothetical protein
MVDEIKVDVEKGGPVVQGQPFKWQNHGAGKIKASGLANVCDKDSYDVDPGSNGKPGEKDAAVQISATLGPHPYNTGPGGTNPVLNVNSSMPKPK